jgi:hypothetical protein
MPRMAYTKAFLELHGASYDTLQEAEATVAAPRLFDQDEAAVAIQAAVRRLLGQLGWAYESLDQGARTRFCLTGKRIIVEADDDYTARQARSSAACDRRLREAEQQRRRPRGYAQRGGHSKKEKRRSPTPIEQATLIASLALLRDAAPAQGSLPPHPHCSELHVAGQPPGYFAGARAYHDALPEAFCGCNRCADRSDEYRDEYDAAELI